jgi:hypothetical protein
MRAGGVEKGGRAVSLLLSVAFTAALVLGHEAAWADKGWYPHEPPLSAYDDANQYLDGYRILTSESVSKWNHAGSYDTAAECETDMTDETREWEVIGRPYTTAGGKNGHVASRGSASLPSPSYELGARIRALLKYRVS